jgi:hypothetical protein
MKAAGRRAWNEGVARELGAVRGDLADAHRRASAFRRRIVKERLLLALAGVAASAVVVGGIAATAAPAAADPTVPVRSVAASTVATASTITGSANGGDVCGPVLLVLKRDYDRLPDAVRKDVASASHQSSKTARHDALQGVLKKAQSGGYGSAVESAAKGRKTLVGLKAAWDRLPSSLRDDVKKARAASGETRAADVKAIVSKAESGGYGDRVKDAAGKVKDRLAKCVARSSDSGRTSTPSAPTTPPATPAPTATPTTGA